MAENTRMKDLYETLKSHDQNFINTGERMTQIENELNELHQSLAAVNQNLEYLLRKANVTGAGSNGGNGERAEGSGMERARQETDTPPHIGNQTNQQGHNLTAYKVKFPEFNGENPQGWIREANRFFQLNAKENTKKVLHAGYYMVGVADTWYTEYIEGRLDIDWECFCVMLLHHFTNRSEKKNEITTSTVVSSVKYLEIGGAGGIGLETARVLALRNAHVLIAARNKNSANEAKQQMAYSILIVGGGPSSVELAAEIAVDFPGKKVTLVHRGSRLLEFIGEKAGRKALDWLNSRKVEVILGQSVDLNSEDGVYRTSEGETIAADIHFLCTGAPIGSSWLKKTCLEDSLDAQGRLMVDANLRVKGHNNIFAIGDITDVPELKQGYSAQAHALVAAKNLALLIKGESECSKLTVYKPTSPMALVSLGRREGVVQLPCITVSGRIPGMLKSGDLELVTSYFRVWDPGGIRLS